jgi:ASC-1-like (ASCH) protein
VSTHYLKILPGYFEAVLAGEKTFEVRKDDRGFQEGDTVILQEYNPHTFPAYSGRKVQADVRYILRDYDLRDGCVIFGLKNVRET